MSENTNQYRTKSTSKGQTGDTPPLSSGNPPVPTNAAPSSGQLAREAGMQLNTLVSPTISKDGVSALDAQVIADIFSACVGGLIDAGKAYVKIGTAEDGELTYRVHLPVKYWRDNLTLKDAADVS